MRRAVVLATLVACAPATHAPRTSTCAGLDRPECQRAEGLLRAAGTFGNVRHDYLIDPTSALVPGRGVEKRAESFSILPTRCAEPSAAREGAVDATVIDFTYVGMAIDHVLVSADAELAPWLDASAEATERKVSLVALAFVRDLDPQFFGASPDVAYAGSACTCGRASHFVGAVKVGGLLAYETTVRTAELRGRGLEFFRARLAAGDTRVTRTAVGGLEVDGLETAAEKPPTFHVKNPVPIAYALYPLADVCRLAFPAPEVTPAVIDFGDVPYETEATRLVHVVNRAAIDVRATIGEKSFAIGALATADLPLTFRASGVALGCETSTQEAAIAFFPRDETAPVTPGSHSVRIATRARTGKATFVREEHVDTGAHRKPDYAATRREWTCPDDYAMTSCRTEKAQCTGGSCSSNGYAVNAEPLGGSSNGCRFACAGPDALLPSLGPLAGPLLANAAPSCRFDARMECRLRCR